jgi:hypothetical protein
MSAPVTCEGLAQNLEDVLVKTLRLAEGSRMGSDVVLLVADALTIAGDTAAGNLCSWEAQLFLETAAHLRDKAPLFAGGAARAPGQELAP